ncbi:hypothetical protein PIB30_088019, partial [Stylosanthes scabra]|nr:hypothetical protein [Stylosanthes scabra]
SIACISSPLDCCCSVPALLLVVAGQRLKVVHDTMIPIGRMWMYDRDNYQRGDMALHLYRNGFMPSYWIWTEHGEIDEVGVNRSRNEPIANMDEWEERVFDANRNQGRM